MSTQDLPRLDFSKGNYFQLPNAFTDFFVPRFKKPEIAVYLALRRASFKDAVVSVPVAKLVKLSGVGRTACFIALSVLEKHWVIRRLPNPGYASDYLCLDLFWAAQQVRTHGLFDEDVSPPVMPEAAASSSEIGKVEQNDNSGVLVPREVEFHGKKKSLWEAVRMVLKSDISTTSSRTHLPNNFYLFENVWQDPTTNTELVLWSTKPDIAQEGLRKYADRISRILVDLIGFAPTVRLRNNNGVKES